VISFAPAPGRRAICSSCGQAAGPVHTYGRRRLRDLNLAQAVVELVVPQRKLRCPACGIRIEAHDFLAPHRRYTRRFERAVADLCRILPIHHVARHFGLSWHAVKQIDKRRLEREVGTPCYDGLRLLAVDEVAVHKGQRYLTLVLDLETGRIVWVGQGRSEATLERFFDALTSEQRASIEAVALDMAAGYRKALERACPRAALVYDLFHVVAKYGREVIDRVRSAEVKKRTGEGRRLIKGSRYLLLKNASNLRPDQRNALRELLAANEALNTVYVLKDQLKRIWGYRRLGWARKALEQWCGLARASGIPALVSFARNLQRHAAGILNHCRYPIHTGRLEGINNKIKVIKRQAYGFRDDAYFILKIKGAFPGTLQPNAR
jgi:transposase